MTNKRIQLFIIPYAGGSIASFRRLSSLIDEQVETVTVEFPGRGTRAKERLVHTFDELIDDVSSYINSRRNENLPYAVMGYSMGSIIAYEILSEGLIKGNLKHFFISAEVSPKARALELRQLNNPSDEEIMARVKSLGGFNERLAADKRFAEIYLKPMMSDYRLFFEYRFLDRSTKISTDATVFYCEEDTPLQYVKEWQTLIDGKLDFCELGNNHFFINDCYSEMATIINRNLKKYLQGENK